MHFRIMLQSYRVITGLIPHPEELALQASRRIEAEKSAPRPHGSRRRIRASSPWGA